MAIKSNIIVDQGADYTTVLAIKDDNGLALDISGFTANAMIRKTFSSSNSVSFQTVVTGPTGQITLTLPASNSSAMTPGRYVYDVSMTDILNKKTRVIEGILTIAAAVTK